MSAFWQVLRRMNWVAFTLMAALMTAGVFCVYSANSMRDALVLRELYKSHAWAGVFGIAANVALAFVDYRKLLKFSWVVYLFVLVLLVGVLAIGEVRMGARRWLFGIQPSELAKLSCVMLLASFLGRKSADRGMADFLFALAAVALPSALILCQPDLGTALVLAPVCISMLFVAGTAPRALLVTVAAGVLAVALMLTAVIMRESPNTPERTRRACTIATSVLDDYQVGRLMDFVFPDRAPLSHGWNRRQSQIAVGSGGVWGKGFLKGDQNILGYLPQQVSANDFIFSVLAEEKGFAGSIFVLLCLGGLILSTLFAAAASSDGSGRLLCTGVAMLLFCHSFINIGMAIGMMPITGLPLPFISYGRTFMITAALLMGLVQSVSVHAERKKTARISEVPAGRERK